MAHSKHGPEFIVKKEPSKFSNMASQITKSRNLIWGNLVKRKFSLRTFSGSTWPEKSWWQMAPIEISFVGTFSYDLQGGKQLDSMEFRGRVWGGPQKHQGVKNLSYKMYFFWPFTWGTTTPIYDEDCLRAHLGSTGIWTKRDWWSLGEFVW